MCPAGDKTTTNVIVEESFSSRFVLLFGFRVGCFFLEVAFCCFVFYFHERFFLLVGVFRCNFTESIDDGVSVATGCCCNGTGVSCV
jgi:hypothetical protein